jgi:predicted RNA-binding Zn ribbon-like protein
MLDPALCDAEALLSTGLADVVAVLPDERAAARRLNDVLRRTGAVPQLVARGTGWTVAVTGDDPLAAPAAALAVLVAVGGWYRVKACTRCGRPFLDRTNGASRRGCPEHRTRRPCRSGGSPFV